MYESTPEATSAGVSPSAFAVSPSAATPSTPVAVLGRHVYVELVARGDDATQRFAGIAVQLRGCGSCSEDFDGLLAALRDTP